MQQITIISVNGPIAWQENAETRLVQVLKVDVKLVHNIDI